MIHKMRLINFAFEAIKEKRKSIEIRLNDEKRRLINIGDYIDFENINTHEIIRVKVINLHKFNSFRELFDTFDNRRLGLKDDDTYQVMNRFYSEEEEEKYGVLGIEIELI